MAYYQFDQFGERSDWIRTAQICCTVANAMSGKKSRRFTIADFMPKQMEEQRPRQSVEEQSNVIRRIVEWSKRRFAKDK